MTVVAENVFSFDVVALACLAPPFLLWLFAPLFAQALPGHSPPDVVEQLRSHLALLRAAQAAQSHAG